MYRELLANPVLKRILSVSFWSLTNALGLRFLNLVALYAAARLLAPADYGSLALLQNTAQTWSIFLAGGISLTAARYVGELKVDQPARTISIITTLTRLTVLLWFTVCVFSSVFAEQILVRVFNEALHQYDLWILLFWVLLMAYQTTLQGIITGLEQFRANALYALVGGLLALLIIVLVIPAVRSWIILAFMIGTLVTTAGMNRLVRQTTHAWRDNTWKSFDLSHMRLMLAFGLPAFLSSIAITQAQWHANLQVASGSGGLAELGGLNIALQWYAIILFIPGVVSNSMLPTLSRLSGNRQQQMQFLGTAFVINFGIAGATTMVAVWSSHFILGQYGEHYLGFEAAFRLLALAAAINGASSIFMQQIASYGKGMVLLAISIVWALVFLGYLHFTAATLSTDSGLIAQGYVAANVVQAVLAIVIALTLSRQKPQAKADG